jgi:hypothetical protein
MAMRVLSFFIAVAFAALGANVARSGGLGDDNGEGTDTIFFGTVKDTRGSAIAAARVNVKFKNMSFVTTTDAIGNFRIATTIDPEQSEVSCSKEGYRQSGATRRPPSSGAKSPVEVDCILRPGQ